MRRLGERQERMRIDDLGGSSWRASSGPAGDKKRNSCRKKGWDHPTGLIFRFLDHLSYMAAPSQATALSLYFSLSFWSIWQSQTASLSYSVSPTVFCTLSLPLCFPNFPIHLFVLVFISIRGTHFYFFSLMVSVYLGLPSLKDSDKIVVFLLIIIIIFILFFFKGMLSLFTLLHIALRM